MTKTSEALEEVGLQFHPLSGQFFKLKKTLKSYTIDVKLKSKPGTGAAEFTDTLPPMPAFVGGIAFLQGLGNYHVSIPGDSEMKSLGDPSYWHRITISCNGDVTRIYKDGEYEGMSSAAPEMSKDIRIGRGFSQRFWEGRMEYFDIYTGDQAMALFKTRSAAKPGSKVFSLDSFKANT